jgi:hypothetical protein
MCKVLNARQVSKRPAPDRIYVGRPSKWGNLRLRGRRMSFCATVIDVGHT